MRYLRQFLSLNLSFMRILFGCFVAILCCGLCSAQNFVDSTRIIISRTLKKVPDGKKWILQVNTPVIIQVSDFTITFGNLCNAEFLSSPSFIGTINKGNIYNYEPYGIAFKNQFKIAYTNNYTFQITPVSILGRNEMESEDIGSFPNFGTQSVEFNSGETVFVSGCLESVELTEVDFIKSKIEHRADGFDKNSGGAFSGGYPDIPIRISRGLAGMRILNYPKIERAFNLNCVIVVEVKVDSSGNVVDAKYQPKGSTTDVLAILNYVIEKTKEIRFSSNKSEGINEGSVTFRLKIFE
jgi:hypothetical protein